MCLGRRTTSAGACERATPWVTRAYFATLFARVTKTVTPESAESRRTDLCTRRSSIPPCRTTRRTTVSPPFQAVIRGFGRPGPGTSASGLTVSAAGGADGTTDEPAVAEPADGTALPVAGSVEVADGGGAEEAVELESDDPFFVFIMKNKATIRASPPSTATWTMGLLLIACLIRSQLPRAR